jgi:protein TonB
MRIGHKKFWTPQRLLLACLLASITVHVVVFVWMPAWQRRVAEAPVPVLDVVLVAATPPALVVEPATVAPAPAANPQRRIESQKTDPLPPAVLSAPSVAETVPTVAAASAEAPRVVAESRSPAPVAEVTATPPLFNAAYLRNPAPVYPAIARRSGLNWISPAVQNHSMVLHWRR